MEWARPELRRFQSGATAPLRLLRGIRGAPEILSIHPLTPGALPASGFLQKAWVKLSNMRPDVTLQSVPGRGGMRIMLAVDTLSLFRR